MHRNIPPLRRQRILARKNGPNVFRNARSRPRRLIYLSARERQGANGRCPNQKRREPSCYNGWVCRPAGRSLPGKLLRSLRHLGGPTGERKVRAPQDTVVGNAHRPNKDRESATESIPP